MEMEMEMSRPGLSFGASEAVFKAKTEVSATRTWLALCNPGQRRAVQVLIANMEVDNERRQGSTLRAC